MTGNSDLRAEISAYLGKTRTLILDILTEKEWETFKALKINPKRSYFVKGNKPILKKFEAYFLFLCAYNKPLYKNYLFEDYAKLISTSNTVSNNNSNVNDDLDEVGIDRELVILYMHDVQMGLGNTTGWLTVTVLDKIANRNRQGSVTLVLSERDFVAFQDTSELKYIDLGGATIVAKASEIAESIGKKKEEGKAVDTSLSTVQKEISNVAKNMKANLEDFTV